MGPLNQDARREGRKAMEMSLTAAARVRRKIKAGPRMIRNEILTPIEAIKRLATKVDNARRLMREEKLSPNDIRCALIFCTPEVPGHENAFKYKWLPEIGESRDYFMSEEIRGYFLWFEDLSYKAAILFLGILWYQEDREARAKGEPGSIAFITPFMGGPKAEKLMLAAKDHFIKGGNKTQDN